MRVTVVHWNMVNEKLSTNVAIPAVKYMEVKGKQKLKGDRVKAVWDDKKHAVFIRICLDQMRAGNKPHKTLNKLGYLNLEKEFYRQTGFRYHKDQLKNHWDSTRRDWQAWRALRNQAGIDWDETRGTYSQTEEWWAEFVKRFPGGDKFAHRPLEHADDLDVLFGEGSGRADAPQSPSSDATPSAGTRDSESDPTPESHAEAEELNCPNTGNHNSTPSRSPWMEEFGETISPRHLSSQAPAARSEKRPRSSDGVNWESCMKQVYDILMGGSRLLAPSAEDNPTSIPNVIALLNETRGIVRNSEEWLFAASKFRNESVRQLFFALGDPECRAAWIKREYKLAHG
ncbi:hypothetical protein Taro_023204 [Colocasia esculenta]|uniref:Myb/SANT-like domain-containing protein n=1 Tax=Colocasia esculenta TaxID=4460 RepID=A0A843V422_COLES|nr:hypothetical protein [Colocasia esculenta]